MDVKLKCLAVDDEPFALQLISDDLGKIPFLQVVGTCSSAAQATSFLEKNPVDLLFLDIQMPEVTGIQFLRSMAQPPMTIFTTAYHQYALEGFELEVIDYLMKPIPFERLQKAANRAKEQFQFRSKSNAEKKFLYVHSEYKEIKIDTADIEYIEGYKDYIKIFLSGQARPILTRMNLKAVEQRLSSNDFCRIHNSFIVPLAKITSFQKAQLFIGTHPLPIGEKFAESFLKKYKQE